MAQRSRCEHRQHSFRWCRHRPIPRRTRHTPNPKGVQHLRRIPHYPHRRLNRKHSNRQEPSSSSPPRFRKFSHLPTRRHDRSNLRTSRSPIRLHPRRRLRPLLTRQQRLHNRLHLLQPHHQSPYERARNLHHLDQRATPNLLRRHPRMYLRHRTSWNGERCDGRYLHPFCVSGLRSG